MPLHQGLGGANGHVNLCEAPALAPLASDPADHSYGEPGVAFRRALKLKGGPCRCRGAASCRIVPDGLAADLRENENAKEFYLDRGKGRRRSVRDIKRYRRRKGWLA